MFQQNHIEDYLDNRDLHEDYYTLIEEYSGTELYQEVIHFMYLAFPNWTSNNGIGCFAAEFVLTSILNLEYVYNDNKMTSTEKLKDIYLSLVADYHSTKSTFDLIQSTKNVDEFERECDFELENIEHLENDKYDNVWNKLYNEFKEKYLSHITYDFLNEDEIILS